MTLCAIDSGVSGFRNVLLFFVVSGDTHTVHSIYLDYFIFGVVIVVERNKRICIKSQRLVCFVKRS